MNSLAINEFESFLKQYLEDKKNVDNSNLIAKKRYKSELDNLISRE